MTETMTGYVLWRYRVDVTREYACGAARVEGYTPNLQEARVFGCMAELLAFAQLRASSTGEVVPNWVITRVDVQVVTRIEKGQDVL